MALQEIKSTALELVADGNLGKALHLVGDFLKSGFYHDDYRKFVNISGDYFSTIRQKINGIIDGEEFLKKEGLIRSRFIDFLDFLKDESEIISSSPNLPMPEQEEGEMLQMISRLSAIFSSLTSKQEKLEEKIREYDSTNTLEKIVQLNSEINKLRIDVEINKREYYDLYFRFSKLKDSIEHNESHLDIESQIIDFQEEIRYRLLNIETTLDESRKQIIDIDTNISIVIDGLMHISSRLSQLHNDFSEYKRETFKVKFLRLLGFSSHKKPNQ